MRRRLAVSAALVTVPLLAACGQAPLPGRGAYPQNFATSADVEKGWAAFKAEVGPETGLTELLITPDVLQAMTIDKTQLSTVDGHLKATPVELGTDPRMPFAVKAADPVGWLKAATPVLKQRGCERGSIVAYGLPSGTAYGSISCGKDVSRGVDVYRGKVVPRTVELKTASQWTAVLDELYSTIPPTQTLYSFEYRPDTGISVRMPSTCDGQACTLEVQRDTHGGVKPFAVNQVAAPGALAQRKPFSTTELTGKLVAACLAKQAQRHPTTTVATVTAEKDSHWRGLVVSTTEGDFYCSTKGHYADEPQ